MGGGGALDRRYQVFISSTYLDLTEERQEVIQAPLELDCFPAGMELFPASNDERWDLIKSVIDDSDYYIVIVGGRYGSLDEEGISYTEKEYDYAVATGKPVLGFLHGNPNEIPAGKVEMSPEAQEKLGAFRDKVSQRMCKKWTNPSELGSVVSRALIRLMKTNPGVGWIKGDNALTPEQLTELMELRQRVSEFELGRATAPPGSEEFASGWDEISLSVEFLYYEPGGTRWDPYDSDVVVSWNYIFSVIGPSMYDEASEARLSERLRDALIEDYGTQIQGDLTGGRIDRIKVSRASLEKVIVQLVALGLIEKSTKKHGVNDNATYWRLTPYGETSVMVLHAVRKT